MSSCHQYPSLVKLSMCYIGPVIGRTRAELQKDNAAKDALEVLGEDYQGAKEQVI